MAHLSRTTQVSQSQKVGDRIMTQVPRCHEVAKPQVRATSDKEAHAQSDKWVGVPPHFSPPLPSNRQQLSIINI